MTPAGRSRQYVQEISRRIGQENLELGNACRGVVLRGGAEPDKVPVDGVLQEPQAVVEGVEGAGAGDPVDAAEEAAVGGETGRWGVVDSKGTTRVFDEVRGDELREGKLNIGKGCLYSKNRLVGVEVQFLILSPSFRHNMGFSMAPDLSTVS